MDPINYSALAVLINEDGKPGERKIPNLKSLLSQNMSMIISALLVLTPEIQIFSC